MKEYKNSSEELAHAFCRTFEDAKVPPMDMCDIVVEMVKTTMEETISDMIDDLLKCCEKCVNASFLTRWYYERIYNRRQRALSCCIRTYQEFVKEYCAENE